MPIAVGEPWGEPGPLPADGVVVHSDAEASAALEQARHAGRPLPTLGLLGGDLCRTLAGSGQEDRLRSSAAMRFPLDLGEVLIDGRLHLFVAHLVARSALWTRAFVAMNGQWLGDWNLGPRAHPNDGLLDTYDVRLRPSQLLPVRLRVRHGAHLPHPGIRERRTAAIQVTFERPLRVALDGRPVGRARALSLRAEPDALIVVV